MKEFNQQMYVATTTIDGIVVDTPTKEQLSSNLHDYVTKLECVNSGCPASAEIRDASDPLNECRYLV
jgi:hypothetical protein